MSKIKLIIKGNRCNLVILGTSLDEVVREYESNRKRIDELVGYSSGEFEASEHKERLKKPSGSTMQDRIISLINEGYFQTPRMAKEVKEALKERGFTYSFEHVSIGLVRLVRRRELRRLAQEKDGKTVYVYTNP
ncbi:MAG: hypothetical protein NWF09_03250 [Candidatus Bathyarchaeota archaeon]|nr:hypothetical protein [Candidatus Bathyarchaeota archaeon]